MRVEDIDVGKSYRSKQGIVAHVDGRMGDKVHWTVGTSSDWTAVEKFAKWAKEEARNGK